MLDEVYRSLFFATAETLEKMTGFSVQTIFTHSSMSPELRRVICAEYESWQVRYKGCTHVLSHIERMEVCSCYTESEDVDAQRRDTSVSYCPEDGRPGADQAVA